MVKCPKCGKENLDDMKYCGYCSASLEQASDTHKAPTFLNKKLIFVVMGVVIAGCIGIFTYLNSTPYQYSNAEKAMLEENYALAAETFGRIKDYKDSEELYILSTYNNAKALMEAGQYENAQEELSKIADYEDVDALNNICAHMVAVQNDTVAPVITGIENNAEIEINYEETFNFVNYLHKTISVTDDVSGDITEYNISASGDIYNAATGDVDTTKAGEYEFIISVKDESGNKSSVNVVVRIDDTIYVTKDNRYPVLCDNEEFGTYKLKSLFHGYREGVNGYILDIDIENKYTDTIYAYIGRCYINDYKVDSYFGIDSIATNKKGVMESFIYDKDLGEKTSEFEYIEASFVIKKAIHGFSSMDETVYSRPIVIYRDAFA